MLEVLHVLSLPWSPLPPLRNSRYCDLGLVTAEVWLHPYSSNEGWLWWTLQKQWEIQVAGVGWGGESKGPSLSALAASKCTMWVCMCLLAIVADLFFLGSAFSDVPMDHTWHPLSFRGASREFRGETTHFHSSVYFYFALAQNMSDRWNLWGMEQGESSS